MRNFYKLFLIFKKKKKRKTKEIQTFRPESEFSVETKAEDELTIEDLMSTVKDTSNFGELKNQLDRLQKRKKQILSEPLPEPTSARLTRKAGYEETKKDITKWQPFVQTIRNKDHISFPLNEKKIGSSTAALVADFTPSNPLEIKIEKILKQSGLQEKQIKQQEQLELNKLTEEEVKQRRAELIKMRNLMFYQELKSKRKKKNQEQNIPFYTEETKKKEPAFY